MIEEMGRMKKEQSEKKKTRLLVAGCVAIILLTGCGAVGNENYTQLGMTAIGNLEYEEALAQFALAEENGENSRLLYRGMGIAYMGLTQYADAITYLEAALAASDGRVENMDYDMNYYLAIAYFKNGQPEDAISAYDAIIGLDEKAIDAYYLRGCVKLSLDRYEEAQADFDQSIALDKKNYDRLIHIYMALEEYGYKEVGQTYLQTAITENEKSISDYDMGRICYYLEDYESARDYLTNLKTDTDYGAALYLGRTYEALGDYNYASTIYDNYTINDQSKAEIYNQLGLCRMHMGEYELALSSFQTAMDIEDNGMMQTLKFNEIVAYEYMEDYKTAAALMNSYLRAYPDDENAKREYEFLQTR